MGEELNSYQEWWAAYRRDPVNGFTSGRGRSCTETDIRAAYVEGSLNARRQVGPSIYAMAESIGRLEVAMGGALAATTWEEADQILKAAIDRERALAADPQPAEAGGEG